MNDTNADYILLLLYSLVSLTAKGMQYNEDAHLPFFEKKQLYEVF